MNTPKPIEHLAGEIATLEVYQCDCGFHMGLDASYLEQVGSIKIACPSCGTIIESEVEDWELEDA